MRTTRATVVVLAGAATLGLPASAAARSDLIPHRVHRADRLRDRAVHLARALDRANERKVRTHGERRLVKRAAVPRLHHRVRVLRHKLDAARAPAPVSSTASPALQAIAACESGGNPAAIGGGGLYRGKYQFDEQTWRSVGGSGDPAAASEAEQDHRASLLYEREGTTPWPVCGR